MPTSDDCARVPSFVFCGRRVVVQTSPPRAHFATRRAERPPPPRLARAPPRWERKRYASTTSTARAATAPGAGSRTAWTRPSRRCARITSRGTARTGTSADTTTSARRRCEDARSLVSAPSSLAARRAGGSRRGGRRRAGDLATTTPRRARSRRSFILSVPLETFVSAQESAGAPPPPPGPPPQAASRGAGRGAGFMSASASSFNPNASAFNPLEGAMNRMHLGGGGVVGGGGGGVVGGGLYAPPLPPSAPAWGGAGYHHQQPVVGDGGGEGDEDWGYEDEQGNWISFNEGGGDEVEFLKSQLPDEDDLLDGLGAEPPQQHGGGGGGADDEWGYYDDAGRSLGGRVRTLAPSVIFPSVDRRRPLTSLAFFSLPHRRPVDLFRRRGRPILAGRAAARVPGKKILIRSSNYTIDSFHDGDARGERDVVVVRSLLRRSRRCRHCCNHNFRRSRAHESASSRASPGRPSRAAAAAAAPRVPAPTTRRPASSTPGRVRRARAGGRAVRGGGAQDARGRSQSGGERGGRVRHLPRGRARKAAHRRPTVRAPLRVRPRVLPRVHPRLERWRRRG